MPTSCWISSRRTVRGGPALTAIRPDAVGQVKLPGSWVSSMAERVTLSGLGRASNWRTCPHIGPADMSQYTRHTTPNTTTAGASQPAPASAGRSTTPTSATTNIVMKAKLSSEPCARFQRTNVRTHRLPGGCQLKRNAPAWRSTGIQDPAGGCVATKGAPAGRPAHQRNTPASHARSA
jgi:hypothetical protein